MKLFHSILEFKMKDDIPTRVYINSIHIVKTIKFKKNY